MNRKTNTATLILTMIFFTSNLAIQSCSPEDSEKSGGGNECDRIKNIPALGKQLKYTNFTWGCYIDKKDQQLKVLSTALKKQIGWKKHTHIIAIDGSDKSYNEHVSDYGKIVKKIIKQFIQSSRLVNAGDNKLLQNVGYLNLAFGDELQVWTIEQGYKMIFQQECKPSNKVKFKWTSKHKKIMDEGCGKDLLDNMIHNLSNFSLLSKDLFPNPQHTDLVQGINSGIHYANQHPNELVFFYLISPDLVHNPSQNKTAKVAIIPKNFILTWNMKDNPKLKGKTQSYESNFRKKVGLEQYNLQDFLTTFRGADLNP
jgi:hypothetical protein